MEEFFRINALKSDFRISSRVAASNLRTACSKHSLCFSSPDWEIVESSSYYGLKSGLFPIERSKMKMGNHDGLVEAPKASSQFGLLLQSLDTLEEFVHDSNAMNLEQDILLQLNRLGALHLFKTCLTRTLKNNYDADVFFPILPTDTKQEESKPVIRTGKRDQRIARRNKNLRASSFLSKATPSNVRRRLNSSKSEAEISGGVKVLAKLEKIWMNLEKELGKEPSIRLWAEACELDKKALQQQLQFGWYCRDELIKSTRALILFLARNYKSFGIGTEDLLQAGYIGVLKGAERFDHTKGYRFSTYVRYWILKSISKSISTHTRGISLPCTVNRTIKKISTARRTLRGKQGKPPTDQEIAEFTNLSVANVQSASKFPSVVTSIDQKLGDRFIGKHMEFLHDECVPNPEEAVTRQHMRKEIGGILMDLDKREREVLLLRFGFGDHRPKSLEEIGRIFHVSKEWVRRLEKKVLLKISKERRNDLTNYASL